MENYENLGTPSGYLHHLIGFKKKIDIFYIDIIYMNTNSKENN